MADQGRATGVTKEPDFGREDFVFNSRRTALLSRHAAVSCDNPHAARVGTDILRAGGNAADAAVAVAAAMGVTQPNTTGLGGDVFCLYYDASQNKVLGLNGSGRSPSGFSLDLLKSQGFTPENPYSAVHGHTVTIPGAAAAWVDTVKRFGSGKFSMSSLLEPAIGLAEEGFPVTEVVAHFWDEGSHHFHREGNPHGKDMLVNGKAPKFGQIMRNPRLANSMKEIAKNGKEGFYKGRIAQAIVDIVGVNGGVMTMEDLANHTSTFVEPISVSYKDKIRLWEIPPNGQGIVALMALNILENFDISKFSHNSSPYIHVLSEALKLAFADGLAYVTDPDVVGQARCEQMLSKSRAKERSSTISMSRASNRVTEDKELYRLGTDTTYFTVTDDMGNACSFIASNFNGFGSGIVPQDCGFTLQNRGYSFSLSADHPNVAAPNKRPFHTIIPGMVTCAKTGELLSSFGVMGGYMQPQGHVQVLLNMLHYGLDPQKALDQPRIYVKKGEDKFGQDYTDDTLVLEEGIPDSVAQELTAMGHRVTIAKGHERAVFGRGHVITKGAWWSQNETDEHKREERIWWAGTDPRCDGLAAGY